MKTLNQLYQELPAENQLTFREFIRLIRETHRVRRIKTPEGHRYVIVESKAPQIIPSQLESPEHPGYALQEDVWRHFSPHTTLRMFTENFPLKHIRLTVSYNPLKRRNFYPMDSIHKDSPLPIMHSPRPVGRPAKAQPQPQLIPYRKSYLQHALLHLQNEPQFTRRRLYLFYTQKMPQRPPLEHFPHLTYYHLTPEGLKAILQKNRWPL